MDEPRVDIAALELWSFAEPGLSTLDLAGYAVEALDGGIGKVDEANDEAGASYLVIDTGPWIFGKKVILPAGVVERVDPDTQTVFVDRTKDEIENAPPFGESTQPGEVYRTELGGYYGARRRMGPGQIEPDVR
jgi:hypothetical protein